MLEDELQMSHLLRQEDDNEIKEIIAVQLMYLLYTVFRL